MPTGAFRVNHITCSCKWMWTVFNQISHFLLSIPFYVVVILCVRDLRQKVHGMNKVNMLLFPLFCVCLDLQLRLFVCMHSSKPPLLAPLKIIEMWRSHIKACHQHLVSDVQMKQTACSPEVQMDSEWCQIHYNGIWSTLKHLCYCSHWQRLCLWLTMTLCMAADLLDLYKLRVWLRVIK